MQFRVKEDVKLSDIYRRFEAQYVVETLSHRKNGVNEVKLAMLRCSRHAGKSLYSEAFQVLVTHWDKRKNVAGEYVKKISAI